MKQQLFKRNILAFCAAVLISVSSCESRKPESVTAPKPQVFNPVEEEPDKTAVAIDSSAENLTPEMQAVPEEPIVKAERPPMPTEAELKKITPTQEAKRELSKDAMKAFSMKPEKFADYMKTRIPYYQGKGNLKAENDLVRIQITDKEMTVETMKGAHTFPMQ